MKRNLTLTALLMLVAATVIANCTLNPSKAGASLSGTAQGTQGAGTADQQTAIAQEDDSDGQYDFTLTDISGKPFSLKSLRGKVVVLDFWGSWCGWCIKGMPDMKAAYQKHQGKLEIVGIDCGDKEEKWKAAVEQLQLPWIHVYNPRGEGDITGRFGIQGFPTKFVIGKSGELLLTVIGEDPAFYTQLDSIMAVQK